MATETGTATDYRDLLQKFKLFLTGENVSPPSGLSWEVMEERSSSTSPDTSIPAGDPDEVMDDATNNDQSHDQIIFRGTGGVSPERDIYFAIQTLGLSTTGYYNWQIRGLTGFAQNSPITDYVSLADQPGRSPPCYLLLQNTTMTYWFIANDRHIKGCVKTGSAYHCFYFGFMNTFATEAEYPYPLVVAATGYTEELIFSSNSTLVSSSIIAGGGDGTTGLASTDLFQTLTANGWVRFTDGNWYAVKNFAGTQGIESSLHIGVGLAHVWPMADTSIAFSDPENRTAIVPYIPTQFRSETPGNSVAKQILRTFGSPELTVLFPLTMYLYNGAQLIGEYDGCYWAPGAGGLTSEDEIIDSGESPEVTNLVFQNVWKTDAWQFIAMRNE